MRSAGVLRACLAVATILALALAPPAAAATRVEHVTVSDGVRLEATLTAADPGVRRPTVVEFSPYGRGTGTFDPGPAFDELVVEVRGTGASGGTFDALGPRTQQDVAEVLAWACRQPWSDGTLAVNGFSASAIVIYNSLHLRLPCVKAAVLRSGTFELYRDLLVPGGISNLVPGAVVLGGIGAVAGAQSFARGPDAALGAIAGSAGVGLEELRHPALDAWWRDRGFRGDVDHVPTLVVAGFFDVESRGAFEGYRALRRDGAHLLVAGAHDAAPRGTDGGRSEMRAWLDHYVRGVDNGVERHPRVQMLLADGDRRTYAAGAGVVRRDAGDWPVPGTRWRSFALAPGPGGGRLAAAAPPAATRWSSPAVASVPTMTDVPNAAILDAAGLSRLTDNLTLLGDMRLAEPLGLSWTSARLRRDLLCAGPASLEVTLSSTAPTGSIWAVVSDVSPDGVPHPLTVGRLSTDFPDIDMSRSLRDPRTGDVVEPYGRYDAPRPAAPGVARRYRVEIWPLGNRFRAGHRIRLHLVGASAASPLAPPAMQTVTVGGARPSRLLLPVVPGKG